MARLMLLFRLARRNVLRNRRRSTVVLVAIAVAVWCMIVFAAFVRGWSDDVVHSAITTLTGHLQIHAPGYLDDPSADHLMPPPGARLRALLDGHEVLAWSTRVRVPAVVMSERETAGVTLVGIDPRAERNLSFIAGAVKAGRALAGVDDPGILLGRALANRLMTGVGKRVVVMSQAVDHSVAEVGFRVVGLYEADRESSEMSFVFVGRSVAAKMLGSGARVSELSATLRDLHDLPSFIERARAAAPTLDVQSWTSLEPMAQAMVALGDAWIWMVNVIAYVAMAFGLVNTLLMAVRERTREFGMLQALGMRSGLIVRQVLIESSLLIAAGALVGGTAAALTLALLHGGVDLSAFAQGAEMWGMSKVVYPTSSLGDVVGAVALIAGLGLLASLYPAARAARRVPVDAITRG
jgi:ABC-type lipoprotein release transport system permease subunit